MPLIKLDMSELAQAISNLGRAESWVPPVIHKQMPMLGKQISSLMKNQLAKHDYMGTLSKAEHDKEITEDEKNRLEKQMQEKVDEINKSIDSMARA